MALGTEEVTERGVGVQASARLPTACDTHDRGGGSHWTGAEGQVLLKGTWVCHRFCGGSGQHGRALAQTPGVAAWVA